MLGLTQLRDPLEEGSSIDIYVSTGVSGFEMKDYTGQNYTDAVDDLTSNYDVSESQITIENISTSDYAEGVIISQTPSEEVNLTQMVIQKSLSKWP